MEEQKKLPAKPKPREEGCDVRFKRDGKGRIVGFKASGKCTRDHLKLAQGSVEDFNGDED